MDPLDQMESWDEWLIAWLQARADENHTNVQEFARWILRDVALDDMAAHDEPVVGYVTLQ
jgi:hypothetical protein